MIDGPFVFMRLVFLQLCESSRKDASKQPQQLSTESAKARCCPFIPQWPSDIIIVNFGARLNARISR